MMKASTLQTVVQIPLVETRRDLPVLSTAAVTVVNQLEIEQQSAYQIYIPMFIGIYVISRWIDSRFNQAPPSSRSKATRTDKQPLSNRQGLRKRGRNNGPR